MPFCGDSHCVRVYFGDIPFAFSFLVNSGGGASRHGQDRRGRADHREPVPQLPQPKDVDYDPQQRRLERPVSKGLTCIAFGWLSWLGGWFG